MTAHKYSFHVAWSDEDEAYVAISPEFEGVTAFGSTVNAAIKEANAALKLAMDVYAEKGWPLPEPSKISEYSGQFRLRLPKKTHARLAQQAAEEGVSLNTHVLCLLERNLGGQEVSRDLMKQLQDVLASATRSKNMGTAAAVTAAPTGTPSSGFGPAFGVSRWPN